MTYDFLLSPSEVYEKYWKSSKLSKFILNRDDSNNRRRTNSASGSGSESEARLPATETPNRAPPFFVRDRQVNYSYEYLGVRYFYRTVEEPYETPPIAEYNRIIGIFNNVINNPNHNYTRRQISHSLALTSNLTRLPLNINNYWINNIEFARNALRSEVQRLMSEEVSRPISPRGDSPRGGSSN